MTANMTNSLSEANIPVNRNTFELANGSRNRAKSSHRRTGRWFLNALKGFLRILFKILPFRLCLFGVTHLDRRFCHLLPPNHTVKFRGYYKSLGVEINTTYPIERQMLSGQYDSSTVRILERFVRAGDTCLDVGANVGALTLVMGCLVGERGKVFAFEPGPKLFAKLQTNLALNPRIREHSRTYQCGLSDGDAELRWEEDSVNRGNAFLSKTNGDIIVPVRRLDQISELSEENIRFVKIDVEGMELKVLRGAREMIRRTRCLIYFEAMPGARRRKLEEDHEDIFAGLGNFFEEMAYVVFGVGASGRLEPVSQFAFHQNNLAVPVEVKLPEWINDTRR